MIPFTLSLSKGSLNKMNPSHINSLGLTMNGLSLDSRLRGNDLVKVHIVLNEVNV